MQGCLILFGGLDKKCTLRVYVKAMTTTSILIDFTLWATLRKSTICELDRWLSYQKLFFPNNLSTFNEKIKFAIIFLGPSKLRHKNYVIEVQSVITKDSLLEKNSMMNSWNSVTNHGFRNRIEKVDHANPHPQRTKTHKFFTTKLSSFASI